MGAGTGADGMSTWVVAAVAGAWLGFLAVALVVLLVSHLATAVQQLDDVLAPVGDAEIEDEVREAMADFDEELLALWKSTTEEEERR